MVVAWKGCMMSGGAHPEIEEPRFTPKVGIEEEDWSHIELDDMDRFVASVSLSAYSRKADDEQLRVNLREYVKVYHEVLDEMRRHKGMSPDRRY
jgi:hypothetical protein